MKKLSMLLSLIIALCMFVMPIGAMAEPTTAQVIQIANPSLSMDDDTRTMNGLAAQLAFCEGSDVAQFILDLFVGGENATSAMLQIDSDTNVVGYLGGMNSAYSLNLAEVAEMLMTQLAAESGIDMNQVANIVAMAENWTLPDDIMNVIAMHETDFTMTDLGISNNANGVPMQYIQVTGDLIPVLTDVLATVENDPLVQAVIQLMSPGMTSLGLTESMAGLNISAVADVKLGVDETGSIIDANLTLTLAEDGNVASTITATAAVDATNPENILATVNMAAADYDGEEIMNITYDYVITSTSMAYTAAGTMDGMPIAMNFSAGVTDTGLELHINGDMAGEVVKMDFVASIDGMNDVVALYFNVDDMVIFDAKYTGGATANGYAFNLSCTTEDYGTTGGFNLDGVFALTDTEATLDLALTEIDQHDDPLAIALNLMLDSNFNFVGRLTVDEPYGDPIDFELSLTTVEPVAGAYYSGKLAFKGDDGYSTIGASADIHLLTAEVDTDSFYIAPEAAIALLTMDDAQMENAMNEINNIMNSLGEAIMSAYPDVFGY